METIYIPSRSISNYGCQYIDHIQILQLLGDGSWRGGGGGGKWNAKVSPHPDDLGVNWERLDIITTACLINMMVT